MIKLFAITFLLCINAYAVEKVPPDIANSYKLIGVEKTLIGVAENMMSSQGKMIDSITQFVSASASGKTLSSTFKIFKGKSELNINKLKEVMFKQSLSTICGNPLSYFLIVEMGATYTLNYYDASNFFLFQSNYTKSNCLS
jgi:hypothetical protein